VKTVEEILEAEIAELQDEIKCLKEDRDSAEKLAKEAQQQLRALRDCIVKILEYPE
jgi:cell division protein FtsB